MLHLLGIDPPAKQVQEEDRETALRPPTWTYRVAKEESEWGNRSHGA
jgi:hypothetical protein